MNETLLNPPMGWNSYDYYDTTVNEEQIKANADYMAKNLKEYGWEYIVVDIQWYARNAGTEREKYQYIPFGEVVMDEFARLQPCPDRFPSSAGGKGFRELADYVHSLGLKFGIHIMRGIPRQAAHEHRRIIKKDIRADEIADPASICQWNPDMYGLRPEEDGAQDYYDSLFSQYAQWGVDFIKCDDICRMDAPSAKREIAMLGKSIERCGRPMVLSLSPGPAKIEEASYYGKYAQMWRITDDFWDEWPLLLNMFQRCEQWQNHVSPGNFPDCDMLPVGMLGKGFGMEHPTGFSRDEQITMMTLWCIFRSPLMIGAELTRLDNWTLGLLTNTAVLRLLTHGIRARQRLRDNSRVIWTSEDRETGSVYIAVFNLEEEKRSIEIAPSDWMPNKITGKKAFELWTGDEVNFDGDKLTTIVHGHGAGLFRITHE